MAAIFRIKATVISPAFDWGAQQQSTLDWLPLLDILEAQSRQAARREGATLHRNQLELAFTFRHRKAHDPRDKIFAISNIVEHENDEHNKAELRILHADCEETLEEIHSRFEREIKRIAEIEDAHLVSPCLVDIWVDVVQGQLTLHSRNEASVSIANRCCPGGGPHSWFGGSGVGVALIQAALHGV